MYICNKQIPLFKIEKKPQKLVPNQPVKLNFLSKNFFLVLSLAVLILHEKFIKSV